MALLAGVTITIAGCGGTGSSPTSPSTTPSTSGGTTQSDVSGAISNNHGHVATVTSAQIIAADRVTLNIQGQAAHNHVVTLTSDQVRAIAAKTTVSVQSTTDAGHDHMVTFG